MEVKIWNLDPMKMAYVEHVGPYEEVEVAWMKLASWAGANGLFNERTKSFGVYHDNPMEVPAENLRSEACITVDKEVANSGEVKFKDVNGGRYAVAVLLGPYAQLADKWMEFYTKWLPESGEEYRDEPCYEQYLNDPHSTKPEHLVTLLLLPLK
ncbi:AraC family transcriptional regulator [Maridesulfovibrio frigidus]|uniref:AraC family transcriptional regulator n=1 Tax=Maridesulfovibrio frigidus TaxID=340956 RepID=UPI0004E226E3|nr:GyrI-like domain-containing protein [Maridesulfovibrio frigidus]